MCQSMNHMRQVPSIGIKRFDKAAMKSLNNRSIIKHHPYRSGDSSKGWCTNFACRTLRFDPRYHNVPRVILGKKFSALHQK